MTPWGWVGWPLERFSIHRSNFSRVHQWHLLMHLRPVQVHVMERLLNKIKNFEWPPKCKVLPQKLPLLQRTGWFRKQSFTAPQNKAHIMLLGLAVFRGDYGTQPFMVELQRRNWSTTSRRNLLWAEEQEEWELLWFPMCSLFSLKIIMLKEMKIKMMYFCLVTSVYQDWNIL